MREAEREGERERWDKEEPKLKKGAVQIVLISEGERKIESGRERER